MLRKVFGSLLASTFGNWRLFVAEQRRRSLKRRSQSFVSRLVNRFDHAFIGMVVREWRAVTLLQRRTRALLYRWLRRTTHGAMKRAWMRWGEATTVRRIVSVHSFRMEDLEKEYIGRIAALEQK